MSILEEINREVDARLVKAGWDPSKHRRYPQGFPGGLGGQFAPKPGQSMQYNGFRLQVVRVDSAGVRVRVQSADPKKQGYKETSFTHQEFSAMKARSRAQGGVPSDRARASADAKLPGGSNVGAARERYSQSERDRQRRREELALGREVAAGHISPRAAEMAREQSQRRDAHPETNKGDVFDIGRGQTARVKSIRSAPTGKAYDTITVEITMPNGRKREAHIGRGVYEAQVKNGKYKLLSRGGRSRSQARGAAIREGRISRTEARDRAQARRNVSVYGSPARGYSEEEWKQRGDNTRAHNKSFIDKLEEGHAVSPSVGAARITLHNGRYYVDPEGRPWRDKDAQGNPKPPRGLKGYRSKDKALDASVAFDMESLRESRRQEGERQDAFRAAGGAGPLADREELRVNAAGIRRGDILLRGGKRLSVERVTSEGAPYGFVRIHVKGAKNPIQVSRSTKHTVQRRDRGSTKTYVAKQVGDIGEELRKLYFLPNNPRRKRRRPGAVCRPIAGQPLPAFCKSADAQEVWDELNKRALSSASRDKLSDSDFVFPKDRRYPIHDESHARNALARSSGKPEEGAVRAAVCKRYPKICAKD